MFSKTGNGVYKQGVGYEQPYDERVFWAKSDRSAFRYYKKKSLTEKIHYRGFEIIYAMDKKGTDSVFTIDVLGQGVGFATKNGKEEAFELLDKWIDRHSIVE